MPAAERCLDCGDTTRSAGACAAFVTVPPDADKRLLELNIFPSKMEEFALPHAGFEEGEEDIVVGRAFGRSKETLHLIL